MDVKVKMSFSIGEDSYTDEVLIPESEVMQNMDGYVDALCSDLKVRLLFTIKDNHPKIWYKDSLVDVGLLNKLPNEHTS